MRRSVRILLLVMGGLFAIVLSLAAYEVVIFAASTEGSAREEATQDFLRECTRRGLDPNGFRGPQRIKSPKTTYGFVWRNASNGQQIVTMVKYLPAGVESWLSQSKESGDFTPYCDERKLACH